MDRVSSTVSDINFFYLRLTSLVLHFHLHSRLPSLAKRITFFQLNYIYVPPLFSDIKNFVIRCQNLNSTSITSPFLNFRRFLFANIHKSRFVQIYIRSRSLRYPFCTNYYFNISTLIWKKFRSDRQEGEEGE